MPFDDRRPQALDLECELSSTTRPPGRTHLLINRTILRITRTHLRDAVRTAAETVPAGTNRRHRWCCLGLNGRLARGGVFYHARSQFALLDPLTLPSPRGRGKKEKALLGVQGKLSGRQGNMIRRSRRERKDEKIGLGRQSMTVAKYRDSAVSSAFRGMVSATNARCGAPLPGGVPSAGPGNRGESCRNGA